MNNITYMEAEIDDCYEIAKLKGEVWNSTYRGIYSDEKINNYDVQRNEQTFIKIVNNPSVTLFVAKDGEKIIGFMSCGEPYRLYLNYKQEIGLLYILKQYQGHGVGKKLFNLGKETIKKSGYSEFFISCNKYNANALEFYKKMGGIIVHIDSNKDDKSESQVKFHYQI